MNLYISRSVINCNQRLPERIETKDRRAKGWQDPRCTMQIRGNSHKNRTNNNGNGQFRRNASNFLGERFANHTIGCANRERTNERICRNSGFQFLRIGSRVCSPEISCPERKCISIKAEVLDKRKEQSGGQIARRQRDVAKFTKTKLRHESRRFFFFFF